MESRKKYVPFTTAMNRKYLSRPTRELLKSGLLYGDILDFGCGRGADVKWIQEDYKLNVCGYDKFNNEYNKPYLLTQKYDCVICNYVFNVIPDLKVHDTTLKILKNLSDNIYICVRSDKKVVKDNWIWVDEEQGYWTPRNTFQRFYDSGSIDILFGDVTYLVDNNNMKLFKLNKNNPITSKIGDFADDYI